MATKKKAAPKAAAAEEQKQDQPQEEQPTEAPQEEQPQEEPQEEPTENGEKSAPDQQDQALQEAFGVSRPSAQEFQSRKELELHQARVLHNSRTGGGTVKPGEIEDALKEHNERAATTAG